MYSTTDDFWVVCLISTVTFGTILGAILRNTFLVGKEGARNSFLLGVTEVEDPEIPSFR